MKIFFCNEGFKIDGVASYNLYLSSSLKRASHDITVIGRWIGSHGFQKRHIESNVKVIQLPSLKVYSNQLLKRAVQEHPDIIFTDSRRSFPFAKKIKNLTKAKLITVFHDPPQHDRKGDRSIYSLIKNSDVWVTPEKPIHEELKKIDGNLPVHFIQRPLNRIIKPTDLPEKDPFKLLCLGRLSRWKSPGLKIIIDRAPELKKIIPSLDITLIGGGGKFF